LRKDKNKESLSSKIYLLGEENENVHGNIRLLKKGKIKKTNTQIK